jgi:hypothetical protein
MFTVFTKLPIEGEKFWEQDNINVLGFYNTIEDAKQEQFKTAKDYLHSQNESGFKIHETDDVILITKDINEVSKGYIYNSTYIKQKPIFSVHVKKYGQNIPPPPPPPTPVKFNSNSPQILLVQDLQKFLTKGITLKKTGIDLTNDDSYVKNIKEDNVFAIAICNVIDSKKE